MKMADGHKAASGSDSKGSTADAGGAVPKASEWTVEKNAQHCPEKRG